MFFSQPPVRLPAPDSNDPKELTEIKQFARKVLSGEIDSLQYTSRYIRRSYYTVFLMYIFLFVVGLGTAIAAIVRGFVAQNGTDAIPSLIFAGLSAASFFTLFITRPLESLERNTFFSSWIIVIMHNYWTRLMYLKDPTTIDKDLQDVTDKLVTELSDLADKYAAAIGKYPALAAATTGRGNAQQGGGSNPSGAQSQAGGGSSSTDTQAAGGNSHSTD